MHGYLKLLEKARRYLILRYVSFKCILASVVALYFVYLSRIIEPSIWSKGLLVVQYAKFGIILFIFSAIYLFILFAATLSGVYEHGVIFSISAITISTIAMVNVELLDGFLTGALFVDVNLRELLPIILGSILWFSAILCINFIAKGQISYFMWSLMLILISLVGLDAIGYANIAVSEWPPGSLAELLSNDILVLSVLTLANIEVSTNLAFSATILSEGIRKLDRMYKALQEILAGKSSPETSTGGETLVETASMGPKLSFSPLALLMLRGHSGIYALEETSGEILSKVAGFLKFREVRDSGFIKSALGLKTIPKFRVIILSIVVSLLLRLPLAVLSALLAYYLAITLGNLYPELVEVRTPMFSLVVFLLFVIAFYFVGVGITKKVASER